MPYHQSQPSPVRQADSPRGLDTCGSPVGRAGREEDAMELQGPEITAVAVAAMSWETMEPHERAAAYLAATFSPGRRIIPFHNIAFKKARDLRLVEHDGSMHDLCFRGLEVALSRDQKRRELEAAEGSRS